MILLAAASSALALVVLAVTANFWAAVLLIAVWGVASSIDDPVHRAYLNDSPSKRRATVPLLRLAAGQRGRRGDQPVLGRSADLGGYGFSLLWSGIIRALAIPFVLLSRAEHDPADTAREVASGTESGAEPGDGSSTDAAVPPTAD